MKPSARAHTNADESPVLTLPAPYLALLPELLKPRRHETIVFQPGGPLPGCHGIARVARGSGPNLFTMPRLAPEIITDGFNYLLAHASARGAWFVTTPLLAGHTGLAIRRALLAQNRLDALLCLPPEDCFNEQCQIWLLLIQPRRRRTLTGLIGPRPARTPRLAGSPMTAALPNYPDIVAAHTAWRAGLAHRYYLPGTPATVLDELERFGL